MNISWKRFCCGASKPDAVSDERLKSSVDDVWNGCLNAPPNIAPFLGGGGGGGGGGLSFISDGIPNGLLKSSVEVVWK